jgi:hypothetical protein
MPKFSEAGVDVHQSTDSRALAWVIKADKLGIEIAPATAALLGQEDSRKTVISDEIKGIAQNLRKAWMESIQKSKLKIIHQKHISVKVTGVEKELNDITKLEPMTTNSNYGRFKDIKQDLLDVKRIRKHEQISVNDWVKENQPEYHRERQMLGKRIGYNEAETWLLGDYSSYCFEFNPILTESLTIGVANLIDIHRVPRGRLTDVWHKANRYLFEGLRQRESLTQLLLW